MNKNITNIIRFFLDRLLPPFLRDSKVFMYPLFYVWYKGKNVWKLMNFKENIYTMTEIEFVEYYKIHNSLPSRGTDMSPKSIDFIEKYLPADKSLAIVDIGCGSGHILRHIHGKGYSKLTGCDIVPPTDTSDGINYVAGNVEHLPFADKEFDITICNHTLEHVLDLPKAISELKRITRKRLIITVPCQNYNRYTFDLHINFFPQKSYIQRAVGIKNHTCVNTFGDWSYTAEIES